MAATAEQRAAGRVAVITGAGQGIGRAYARRLAREGAAIVVADLGAREQTVELIERDGGRATGIAVDVSSPESVAELAAKAVEAFGRVDVLVNNAGVYPVRRFLDIPWQEWRQVLSVNLDGSFLTAQAFLPGMIERGWGRIVNISSSVVPFANIAYSHYTASKAGIEGLTRALASEVGGHGVTVNAIAPGLTKTETTTTADHAKAFEYFAGLQAIPRPEVPEDLAGALAFLVSDDAAFITGHVLVVNGGMVRIGIEPGGEATAEQSAA